MSCHYTLLCKINLIKTILGNAVFLTLSLFLWLEVVLLLFVMYHLLCMMAKVAKIRHQVSCRRVLENILETQ